MATGTEPSKARETRAALDVRGRVPVTVTGGCMDPTLRTGQTVWVRRALAPRVGDVALLDCSGWLEIHRLVGRVDAGPRSWFVHMGDASQRCGVAGPGDILGLIDVVSPRRAPAPVAHLWTLLLRLGALLVRLGLAPLGQLARRGTAASKTILFREA